MESESQENYKNRIYIYINVTWRIVLYFLYYINIVSYTGFPDVSGGKESTSNAEDPGSIPREGRSTGEGMAIHSNILTWRIPWTEESVGL